MPPKPRRGVVADRLIKAKVTADELALIRSAAEREVLPLAEWIRQACLAAARADAG